MEVVGIRRKEPLDLVLGHGTWTLETRTGKDRGVKGSRVRSGDLLSRWDWVSTLERKGTLDTSEDEGFRDRRWVEDGPKTLSGLGKTPLPSPGPLVDGPPVRLPTHPDEKRRALPHSFPGSGRWGDSGHKTLSWTSCYSYLGSGEASAYPLSRGPIPVHPWVGTWGRGRG